MSGDPSPLGQILFSNAEQREVLPTETRRRELLAPDCAVIEYQPLIDSVRCTVISAEAVTSIEVEVPRDQLLCLKLQAAYLEPGLDSLPSARTIVEELRANTHRFFINPLLNMLQNQGIQRIATVGLGQLARVPFHIALDETGRPISDHFDVSYLPSLELLSDLRSEIKQTTQLTVLADPTANLPIVRGLALALQQFGADVRLGRDVDRETVIAHLRGEGHLLICCHASEHGLELADGTLDAGALDEQLVTSSCSSVALIACRAAHGFLSFGSTGAALPRVLLRKGAGVVVAARWKLPELSAAFFADHWARSLLQDERPIVAYRRAADAVGALSLREFRHWIHQMILTVREFDTDTASPTWLQAAIGMDLAGSELVTLTTASDLLADTYKELALIPLNDMKISLNDITVKLEDLRNAIHEIDRVSVDPVHGNNPLVFNSPVERFGFFLYGLPN